MLVLSRKTGERIQIGENISIEIRRIAGNRVTLALNAPRDVRILRGELAQAAVEFRDADEAESTDSAACAQQGPWSACTHQQVNMADSFGHAEASRNYAI